MARQKITDRWLKSKNVAAGDYWDATFPSFGVRVAPTGRKTFVMAARFKPGASPTRRALGTYPKISLEKAREKAQHWTDLLSKGINPADDERRQRVAEQRKRDTTFAAVAKDFIRDKLPRERRGWAAEKELHRDLIPPLGKRPIAEITSADIRQIINAKKADAPVAARNLLALVKRFFAWVIEQEVYGIEASPAQSIRPTKIIGERTNRDRILTDVEFRALWRAAERLPYPHGPVYRMLILTGLRLNEAARATWSEFDLPNGLWTIPAARMKGRNGKAREHGVPLTRDILDILESLPRFQDGKFLFSTDRGKSPAWIGDKVKQKIDARMLRTLEALARMRGEDPATAKLEPWRNHDIRRTLRSGLSRLRVPEVASEAVLAHVRPGIIGVYDRHGYLAEKREALEVWAAHLRSIVNPHPTNVTALRKTA